MNENPRKVEQYSYFRPNCNVTICIFSEPKAKHFVNVSQNCETFFVKNLNMTIRLATKILELGMKYEYVTLLTR